ncbi:hypothetical protein [Chryseobacterium phosphatilyticum]|nr:hypothetical protein [Chryseobacterium phosphatilyticum]
MKKIIIMSFALSVFSISTMNAQSLFDKIDNLVSKIDKASNTVDNAANKADKASKTGGKLGSLFGKKNKNKKNDEKVSEGNNNTSEGNNKTIIKISNIDFTNLKKLNGIVAESKGVTDTDMKFNTASSSITVFHSGNTEDLLSNIQSRAQNIYTDKNISGIDEGMIEIKIK